MQQCKHSTLTKPPSTPAEVRFGSGARRFPQAKSAGPGRNFIAPARVLQDRVGLEAWEQHLIEGTFAQVVCGTHSTLKTRLKCLRPKGMRVSGPKGPIPQCGAGAGIQARSPCALTMHAQTYVPRAPCTLHPSNTQEPAKSSE